MSVKKIDKYFYGLDVYSVDGHEYVVGNNDQFFQAVREYIGETLWAFTSEFIHEFLTEINSPFKLLLVREIKEIQCRLVEDCNEIIARMITPHFDKFVEKVILADDLAYYVRCLLPEEAKLQDKSVHKDFQKLIEFNPDLGKLSISCYKLNSE